MLHRSTPRRSRGAVGSAVTAGTVLLAVGASVLALAIPSGAAVAVTPKQASAQGININLVESVPIASERVSVVYTTRGMPTQEKTAPTVDVPGNQGLITLGVSAAKATAAYGISYGCGGVLAKGGSLDVGSGYSCKANNNGAGGLGINLFTGTTSLPAGIGYAYLRANAITANARFDNTATSGNAKIVGLKLVVCVGASVNGKCLVNPISVPITLKGTPNENVLAAVTDAIARASALTLVANALSAALSSAVVLQSNVQSAAADGTLSVVGLHVGVIGGAVADADLALASAGPYTAS